MFNTSDIAKLVDEDMQRNFQAWTSAFRAMIDDEYYLGIDIRKYENLVKKPESELSDDDKEFLNSKGLEDEYNKYKKSWEINKPKRTFEWKSIE